MQQQGMSRRPTLRAQAPTLCRPPLPVRPCSQADEAAEVAKAEKERLKQQQLHKKQLLEKMRSEQNQLAERGEVRLRGLAPAASVVRARLRRGTQQHSGQYAVSSCRLSARKDAPCPTTPQPTTNPHRPHPQTAREPKQAMRTANRLQFLLRQADLFQHFASAGTVEKAKK
jgi:hypothetical protein